MLNKMTIEALKKVADMTERNYHGEAREHIAKQFEYCGRFEKIFHLIKLLIASAIFVLGLMLKLILLEWLKALLRTYMMVLPLRNLITFQLILLNRLN